MAVLLSCWNWNSPREFRFTYLGYTSSWIIRSFENRWQLEAVAEVVEVLTHPLLWRNLWIHGIRWCRCSCSTCRITPLQEDRHLFMWEINVVNFWKGHPLVFSHAADPLEVDDWVRAVEKQLNIAQCNDLERCYMHLVSYRGQLRLGGSRIKLHVLTMLLLSLRMNLLEILELAIFLKV
jgi:hypothetical protein